MLTKWPEYIAVAERSLAFCQAYKPQFIITGESIQKVLAAAFFAKVLRDAEAAFLLLKSEMTSQARAILRVAIECEIMLGNCVKSTDFAEAYSVLAERQRLRLLRGIHKISAEEFNDVKEVISKEMIDNLNGALKGSSERKVEQLATD